jgi:hypothetical protein
MPRLAFLFGAGASYGAGGGVLPHPPPLGRHLYGELRQAFPETWGNLPPSLAKLFKREFETGMDAMRRGGQEQSRPLLEISRFFATFQPGPEPSCYLRLIRLLESCHLIEGCRFATLNYDCLIDLDLDSAKFGYNDGERHGPYMHQKSVQLWKLHGACNLVNAVGTFRGNQFFGVGQLYEGPGKYVTRVEAIANCDDEGLPPMLSLYAPGKPTPVGANVVEPLRRRWELWVKQSDVIVVIGARILNRDEHLYRPLKKASGQIWYVGDRNDFHIPRPFVPVGRRFDEAIDGELKKRLLAMARR